MKLKPCFCGEIPTELILMPSDGSYKYAFACGNCCGDWSIEFRTNYKKLESPECMELAIKAWNNSPRQESEKEMWNELKRRMQNEPLAYPVLQIMIEIEGELNEKL
jgi:hypothetical protein